MRPCGQGSGCRGQDTNRLSSRKPGSTIVPRVESKRAPHQRANLHPQPFDVGIERVLRTYERKEIHRTWHSKLSGPGGVATAGDRQIVPARRHAANPTLRGSTRRASTGPGEVRHRHLLGRNHHRQTEVPCQAKARLRGRTTALRKRSTGRARGTLGSARLQDTSRRSSDESTMTHPVARVERPEGHRVIASKARARAGGWLHVGAKVLTFANGEAFGTLSQVAVRPSETAGRGGSRCTTARPDEGGIGRRESGAAARATASGPWRGRQRAGGAIEARGQRRRTRSLLLVTQSEL